MFAYVAAALAFSCGFRACEIRGLRWKHIDWARKRLSVRRSKTPAGWRDPSLNQACLTALSELHQAGRTDSRHLLSRRRLHLNRHGDERRWLVEVSTVGREGMIGVSAILNGDPSPSATMVQAKPTLLPDASRRVPVHLLSFDPISWRYFAMITSPNNWSIQIRYRRPRVPLCLAESAERFRSRSANAARKRTFFEHGPIFSISY